MTRTPLSRSKVTRPLCSLPCWRVRRLQRLAWERIGCGKLLLRGRLLVGANRGRRRAWAYRGGRPPRACLFNFIITTMAHSRARTSAKTANVVKLLLSNQAVRVATRLCSRPSPSPRGRPSASRAAEQTPRSSSFPRPTRFHGHRRTCLTR